MIVDRLMQMSPKARMAAEASRVELLSSCEAFGSLDFGNGHSDEQHLLCVLRAVEKLRFAFSGGPQGAYLTGGPVDRIG